MDGEHSKKRPLDDNNDDDDNEEKKLPRLVPYESSDDDDEEKLQMGGAVSTRSSTRQRTLPVANKDLSMGISSMSYGDSVYVEPSAFTQPFSNEPITTLAGPLDVQSINSGNAVPSTSNAVSSPSNAVPGLSGLSGAQEIVDAESDGSDYEEESTDNEATDEEEVINGESNATLDKRKQREAFLFEYDKTPPKIFKKHSAKSFKAKPIREGRDYQREMIHFQRQLVAFLKRERARRYPRGLKVHISTKVRYHVIKESELVDTPEFIFTSKSKTILRSDDIREEMAPSLSHLEEQIADQQVG